MEEELGAPMFQAVVVKNETTDDAVKLQVRYHRKNFFADERKVFEVVALHGSAGNRWLLERYLEAKALRPGDEIYVDPFGEEWCNPRQRNPFSRWWYLNFA